MTTTINLCLFLKLRNNILTQQSIIYNSTTTLFHTHIKKHNFT